MQKIKSLFQRNYTGDRLVYNEVVPGSEWVQRGEGIATRKWDGTSCLVKQGQLFKRYDAKHGKTPPEGFVPAQEPDAVTGHWPGWVPVLTGNPADRWHLEAVVGDHSQECGFADGTYELCGPKVQSNAESLDAHYLIRHGEEKLPDCPTDFEGLREYFKDKQIEGVVWHHPDGRMVKCKRRDFWK